jgi:hypothetical protein
VYAIIKRRELRERRLRRARSMRQYIDTNARQNVYGVTKEVKDSYVVYQARGKSLPNK